MIYPPGSRQGGNVWIGGILIEEYAGDFPLWLAPVQIRLLPVSDSQLDYAKEVTAKILCSEE